MKVELVKIDVAAVDLNKGVRRIEELVDGSTPHESALLWVFNLAVNRRGPIRALRFWRAEILARAAGDGEAFKKMTLAEVISEILPPRRHTFHGGEIDHLLQIRPNTRLELSADLPGQQNGSGTIYQRSALAAFLESRWLGNLERSAQS